MQLNEVAEEVEETSASPTRLCQYPWEVLSPTKTIIYEKSAISEIPISKCFFITMKKVV